MTSRLQRAAALAGFGALTAVAASAGRPRKSDVRQINRRLRLPRLQPPNPVFGVVWGTLYPTIALAGWQVWKAPPSKERSRALRWWGVQLALNGTWPWLYFRKRRRVASLIDSAALVLSIAAFRRSAKRVSPQAAALTLPYQEWTTFATLLNEEVVRLNA